MLRASVLLALPLVAAGLMITIPAAAQAPLTVTPQASPQRA